MAWPTDDLTNDQTDQGTDDPSQARDEINSLLLKVKTMIAGAVSAATASCVVLRDASGNFAANFITAVKFKGDVAADDGTVVLANGTDGSDAIFTGNVNGDLNGNVKGDVYASNGTSKILEAGSDGTDAAYVGAVDLRGGSVNLGSDATGDLWYRNASGFWTRLGIGSADQVLKGGTIPVWGSPVAASSVGQTELKTATGTVSLAVSGGGVNALYQTMAGGEYGFYPRSWVSHFDFKGNLFALAGGSDNFINTSPLTQIQLYGDSSSINGTVYASQRYMQSSPPYKIGDINWGHFLFILRNRSTKEVIAAYEAEDPPWAYNGNPTNVKDSVERVEDVPHPFGDYMTPQALATAGLEIVLIDLSSFEMPDWKADNPGKSIIEDLSNVAPMGNLSGKAANLPSSLARFNSMVKVINRT